MPNLNLQILCTERWEGLDTVDSPVRPGRGLEVGPLLRHRYGAALRATVLSVQLDEQGLLHIYEIAKTTLDEIASPTEGAPGWAPLQHTVIDFPALIDKVEPASDIPPLAEDAESFRKLCFECLDPENDDKCALSYFPAIFIELLKNLQIAASTGLFETKWLNSEIMQAKLKTTVDNQYETFNELLDVLREQSQHNISEIRGKVCKKTVTQLKGTPAFGLLGDYASAWDEYMAAIDEGTLLQGIADQDLQGAVLKNLMALRPKERKALWLGTEVAGHYLMKRFLKGHRLSVDYIDEEKMDFTDVVESLTRELSSYDN